MTVKRIDVTRFVADQDQVPRVIHDSFRPLQHLQPAHRVPVRRQNVNRQIKRVPTDLVAVDYLDPILFDLDPACVRWRIVDLKLPFLDHLPRPVVLPRLPRVGMVYYWQLFFHHSQNDEQHDHRVLAEGAHHHWVVESLEPFAQPCSRLFQFFHQYIMSPDITDPARLVSIPVPAALCPAASPWFWK